jgi:hypothetical protein
MAHCILGKSLKDVVDILATALTDGADYSCNKANRQLQVL